MAMHADSQNLYWFCPEMRGQLSIHNLHIPQSFAKTLRRHDFDVRVDTAFSDVISNCAAQRTDKRKDSWINNEIINVFLDLHAMGYAHSIECWQGGRLVGGLYGLAIGRAFFGESMFSFQSGASKVALIHLVARLWYGDFELLDTQFVNPHLLQFGAYEIEKEIYLSQLDSVIAKHGEFHRWQGEETQLVRTYFASR